MTPEQFRNLEDADVEFQGQVYYCPKVKGIASSPLCTRTHFQNGEESFAHIFEDGVIRRYGTPIGILADLSLIQNTHPVKPDLGKALPNLLNANTTWPGFQRHQQEAKE